jgi:glycerate-2-kinase
MELGSRENVFALAGDTDGIDGTEAVAGAVWRPDTLRRAAARAWIRADFSSITTHTASSDRSGTPW